MATPEEMAATMRANVKEKTGRKIEDWLVDIAKQSFDKHAQIVNYLKSQHAVTHGFANLIAHDYLALHSSDKRETENTDLVAVQYAGAKSAMKPLYDLLIENMSQWDGVEIAPKKSYVSLRRNKQFALIQASTKTRVDVGLQLKGEPVTQRLEASGSFNAMVSHRVRLTDMTQIDSELLSWLKQAYEKA